MVMKRRILSIFVIVAALTVTLISIIVVANKKEDKLVYGKNIKFNSNISGFEMSIDNYLVIDKSMVTVTPSDCSFEPEFTITKYSSGEEVAIKEGKYKFSQTGKHILKCMVKISATYSWHDKISINVVDGYNSSTSMYIKQIKNQVLYVEDCVILDEIVELKYPTNTKITYDYTDNVSIKDNLVTAKLDGLAKIDITLNYNNIIITDTIYITIKPKIIESDIGIIFGAGGQAIDGNYIEIKLSKYTFGIDYKLTNTDFQLIDCTTDSSAINILSWDSPVIVVETKQLGDATIYITPLEHPELRFELLIRVIE